MIAVLANPRGSPCDGAEPWEPSCPRRTYDTLGRQTSYTDADGNVSTTSYDLLGRPVTTNDGKGSQTRSYDPTSCNTIDLTGTHAREGRRYKCDKVNPFKQRRDRFYVRFVRARTVYAKLRDGNSIEPPQWGCIEYHVLRLVATPKARRNGYRTHRERLTCGGGTFSGWPT